jgi:hypothetical protein
VKSGYVEKVQMWKKSLMENLKLESLGRMKTNSLRFLERNI